MRKRTLISGAVIVLFLGLLTAFPLSWYLLPEEARQQTGENRALAEFPSLSSPEGKPGPGGISLPELPGGCGGLSGGF